MNNTTSDNTTTLDDLEISNEAEPLAASKNKKKAGKKDKPPVLSREQIARILFSMILVMIIAYTSTFIKLIGIMGEDPYVIITDTFNTRNGVDNFLVGDLLLTPDQRIENLGIVRQRSSEENTNNTLEFLSAVSDNNPPDIYRSLINPTIDPSLIEETSIGNLPIISQDGRSSLITYARPFNEKLETAEISILVHGLGISENLALAALRLAPEVSLAFSPYTIKLKDLTVEARKAGHEVLLELPLEPSDYPMRDPGPYALRKNFSTEKNISQLEWILSRTEGYVGLINYQGDALLKDKSFVNTILPLVSRRGLMFVEKGDHGDSVRETIERTGSHYTNIDIEIGIDDDEFSVEEKLADAMDKALLNGRVTIGLKPFPLVLMKLALWINELPSEQFTLTPISSRAQIHEAKRLGLTG